MTKIFNRRKTADFRSKLRHSMTKSEAVLWKNINCSSLGYKFRRQHGIGKYVVDFYCPKLKLAVEVDGITHSGKEAFEKDIVREKFLKSNGITVRRYNSGQVLDDLKNVLDDLYNVCVILNQKRVAASATTPNPSLERRG